MSGDTEVKTRAMTRLIPILLLTLLLSGCAIKRRWVSSEQAYDRYVIKMCEKSHPAEECDPNWKPCGKDERCQP